MSLGERIRQLRQTRGLTQSQLGGQELSKSFISLLEKDRTHPSLDTLVLIAGRLGTSVDSLLGQNGNLPEMVCQGLVGLIRDALQRRDLTAARRLLDPATFLATTHGAEEVLREISLLEAQIAVEEGRIEEALPRLDAARHASEQARDFWRAGRALVMIGLAKIRQRDYPVAQRALDQALSALRRAKAGRDPVRVEALIAMGTVLGNLGDYAGAIRRFEEAARSAVARSNPAVRGQALWGIGQAYRKLGSLESARAFLGEAKDALEAAEELGDFIRVSMTLGQLLFEQGQAKQALRHLHHALRATERLGMSVTRASTMTEIARINLALGNLEEATHFSHQALEAATAVHDPVEIAEATVVLAGIHAQRKDTMTAIRLYKSALAAFRQREMAGKVSVVARELGLLLRERGAHARAAEYLALSLEEERKEAQGTGPVVAAGEL